MKQFIDKLIGRLEEETLMYADDAIKIVNQLAGEYNNDFCEWKKGTGYVFYLHKTSCGIEDTFDDSYKFCPYCGKKIKIAPYQPKGEHYGE